MSTIRTSHRSPDQRRIALAQVKSHIRSSVAFAAAFSTKGWNDADWQQRAIRELDSAFAAGAVAREGVEEHRHEPARRAGPSW